MKNSLKTLLYLSLVLLASWSCNTKSRYAENFDKYNDRTWINEDLWPVPIEDWKIADGRVECSGIIADMRLNLLTQYIEDDGEFSFSVDMGIINDYKVGNSSGVRIGIHDNTDEDVRSLCYFGKGIDIGVHTDGYLFIDSAKVPLPEGFNWQAFNIQLDVLGAYIQVTCTDSDHKTTELSVVTSKPTSGNISLVQNFEGIRQNKRKEYPKYYFDNLSLIGADVVEKLENSFGPILFSMYTLSDNTLKLTAQMPPLGVEDQQFVELQVESDGVWQSVQSVEIEKNARIAPFQVENWDASADVNYRICYTETYKDRSKEQFCYTGVIRKEPETGKLSVAGLTCQHAMGFPYRPLSENLEKSDPDMLYFSGDQIYEGNGGYGIYRAPADKAIVNYLGKWYMFGWAFADVMRDRPTVTIPDDHEVFQGNLWGEGGAKVSLGVWNKKSDCISGFVQPMEMVNTVMRTNCSHLPTPYDPTPMKNNIPVYYTDFEYGGVSFAIVGDRIFKSGPEKVSNKKGRIDHLVEPIPDPLVLDKPGLEFLGERQMIFLKDWANSWDRKQIKVLLSQTIFANASTHHGYNKMLLAGDLDTGGWPQTPRDRALEIINSCHAFHICGDQHFPSMVQYGTDDFHDAGWVFCTPAISVGYPRRFLPDALQWDVQNRPAHNLPNTGEYVDAFGNKNYIYTVANPSEIDQHENRYQRAELKASGYGMIHFDTQKKQAKCEAIRFLVDVENTEEAQFPGWPVTIDLATNSVVE